MNISELIKKLAEAQEHFGDMPVKMYDTDTREYQPVTGYMITSDVLYFTTEDL